MMIVWYVEEKYRISQHENTQIPVPQKYTQLSS